MKIINWNVGRPSAQRAEPIKKELLSREADIIVLTETANHIELTETYNLVQTNTLSPDHDGVQYKASENRVSIWTKYPVKKQYKTSDCYTSVCADIETPIGVLTLYGTIIGVFGGKGERFNDDLDNLLLDIHEQPNKYSLCLVGDFNTSFSGYVYPSFFARQILTTLLDQRELINTTKDIEDCVDHIAISKLFIAERTVTIETWNNDMQLSDHIGTAITINDC